MISVQIGRQISELLSIERSIFLNFPEYYCTDSPRYRPFKLMTDEEMKPYVEASLRGAPYEWVEFSLSLAVSLASSLIDTVILT